ncbi:MAG: glycosyl transferase [Bacteroidales bacterium]|nr:glycosyl transferase [Bacteroidales bacterium]
MIPKKIHYCWFGRGEMPQAARDCMETWHRYMPDWEYKLWNEDNFDVHCNAYCSEAYKAGKYAFVSDVARLVALRDEGGIYLDTDVEVFRSFEPLLHHHAFAGFEGCKRVLVATCVMGSEPGTEWVKEQLSHYDHRHFLQPDGTFDLTTNVLYMTTRMRENGFVQNGQEQDYKDLHVFPVDYFSPRHTTGEYIRTENTYSDHLGMGSWTDRSGLIHKFANLVGPKNMTRIIKLKRKLLG